MRFDVKPTSTLLLVLVVVLLVRLGIVGLLGGNLSILVILVLEVVVGALNFSCECERTIVCQRKSGAKRNRAVRQVGKRVSQ